MCTYTSMHPCWTNNLFIAAIDIFYSSQYNDSVYTAAYKWYILKTYSCWLCACGLEPWWLKFQSKYWVHYWVQGPVYSPVQSPEYRFCTVPLSPLTLPATTLFCSATKECVYITYTYSMYFLHAGPISVLSHSMFFTDGLWFMLMNPLALIWFWESTWTVLSYCLKISSIIISAAYRWWAHDKTLLLSNLVWPLTPGDWNSSPSIKSIIDSRVQSMTQSRVLAQSPGFVLRWIC